MAIISSKHFKLSSFHFHKSKKTAVATDSTPPCKYNIAKLPKELLCCIYEQLETVECQNAFSRTCLAFHRIATDMRSNAAWVVTRYGPRFAIYYALLAFPQKCNSQFIQYMISLGAQVPRYLIQVLIQTYGKPIDSIIKSSENRRRRSSFHTFDLDLLFLKAVQQLSFDGYATLIQHAFKTYGGKIDINNNDLELFLTSLEPSSFNKDTIEDLIQNQWFFPAPLSSAHANYRLILKLAQSSSSSYDLIAPVFDFDPLARSSLWESILLLFFDEAFRSTEPTREKQLQLELVQKSIIVHAGRHVHLAGPLTDQQIFCQVFATFFTKYPVGYCNGKTMAKLLRLLKMYVKPNFNIDVALEHMVQANIGRSDTIESVDNFLKENQH